MKLYDNKSHCCGCGACADVCPNIAITFQKDTKGFYYPVIDKNKCTNCGLCKTACAFKKKHTDNNYTKQVYAVKHRNEQIHKDSSSGGIYTAITDYILSLGGVVYGAAYTSSDKVCHIRCETNEERDRTRGSKYVQSDMRDIFKAMNNDLDDGRYVLFSGMPCQTAAVKNIFKNKSQKLYLVDTICHGVPSPGIFKEHIAFCEKIKGKKVKEFLFRSNMGDGRNNTPTIIFDDGEIDSKSKYIRIYFDLFNENKILRDSCFECPFATENRIGDITIGDFWGIEKISADFADKNGVSAVIINSDKGEELYNEVKSQIKYISSSFDDVAKRNPNLKYPSKKPKYATFYPIYRIFGYDKVIKQYCENTLIKRIKIKVTKLLK